MRESYHQESSLTIHLLRRLTQTGGPPNLVNVTIEGPLQQHLTSQSTYRVQVAVKINALWKGPEA